MRIREKAYIKNIITIRMLSDKLEEISKVLGEVPQGDSFLARIGNCFHLVNYDDSIVFETEPRLGEGTYTYSWKDEINKASSNSRHHGIIDIEGNAMIKFNPDKYLGYLPMSANRSLAVTVDEDSCSEIEVIANKGAIMEALYDVVSKQYLEGVVEPFIDGKPTSYKLPKRGWFRRNGWNVLRPVMDEAKIGEKIYIGFDNASWMITKSTPEKASIYTNNYNNPFFVENKKVSFNSGGATNKKSLVIPVAGRGENGYHNLGDHMHNKPRIATRDKKEALEHMKSQPFSDFSDVVDKYMD